MLVSLVDRKALQEWWYAIIEMHALIADRGVFVS